MTDFATLANIARPQMMQAAPLGAGATAGWMYGKDMARQQDYLDQAAMSAQMQQMQDAQKASEFMAGAPGRLSDIARTNMQASDLQGAYQEAGKGLTYQHFYNQLSDENKKGIDSQMEFFSMLDKAKSPEDVQALLRWGKQAGQGQIRHNGKILDMTELPPEAAKNIASAIVEGATSTPSQRGKERIAGMTWGARAESNERIAESKNMTAMQIAKLKADAQAEFQKLKQSNPNLYSMLQQWFPNNPEAQAQFYINGKIAAALQSGQTATDTIRPFLPPNLQDKIPPHPTSVAPQLMPKGTSAPTQTSAQPKVGDVWGTPQGNKKILGIKRDARGNILQLNIEGVGVVDYK